MLILASALAVELHAGVRADQRAAANARAHARLRWTARAGLARATEALRSRLARTAVSGAGLVVTDTLIVPVQTLDLDDTKVRATVVDARSKLNLNLAAPDELRALFAAAGVEPGRAASLASSVARWRAAHLPAYQAAPRDTAGSALRPPPGAFVEVSELREVPGFDAAVYERVSPWLTVASDGRINLNTAGIPVLRTLPGIDARSAAALAAHRRRAPILSPYDVADLLPGAGGRNAQDRLGELTAKIAFVPREAEVRVEAARPGTPLTARIRAVAVMSGGARAPRVATVER